MDELRKTLEAQGWRTADNGMRSAHNKASWYAYRPTNYPARECECNDGKRQQIVLYPYQMWMNGRIHESVEFEVCGEVSGVWFKLRAYSLSPAEALERMDDIETALIAAWNALDKVEA